MIEMFLSGAFHLAALLRSHMIGLLPFEITIEQTTETTSPSHKTITAAGMTRNRITSLRELLHYRKKPGSVPVIASLADALWARHAIFPNYSHILIGSCLWSIRGRTKGRHQFHFFFFLFISLTQRDKFHVVRTHYHLKPLFHSNHILTSYVIYYWADKWQHGVYLLIW